MKERFEKFMQIMGDGIGIDQAKALAETLYEIGFFEAPASTKHHGNYEGGLFDHSAEVTACLLELTEKLGLKWPRKESPYYIGMLHDLCKCGIYKRKDGGYEYVGNDMLPGHGDRSVILAQTTLGITLNADEMLCIYWHMGSFTEKERWSGYTEAVQNCPNVLWTHVADMMASQIKGV